MYHLATIFPGIRRFRIPITRDQAMLLVVVMNELFLGLEHYLAHMISGTLRPNELIPIIFGPVSGVVLFIFVLVALRARTLASIVITLICLASIVVGVFGWYFHFIRAVLPAGPVEVNFSLYIIYLIIWAPPVLGPLTSSLIGFLGISAVWREDPVDSGLVHFFGKLKRQFPFSKSQTFFFCVGMGVLATLISSVLDHARTDFSNPWLWIPLAAGVFGTVVPIMVGAKKDPSRADLITYFVTMLVLMGIGMLGFILHVYQDFMFSYEIVPERFIRGAPFLAPMLFADMGMIGLVILLNPKERKEEASE